MADTPKGRNLNVALPFEVQLKHLTRAAYLAAKEGGLFEDWFAGFVEQNLDHFRTSMRESLNRELN